MSAPRELDRSTGVATGSPRSSAGGGLRPAADHRGLPIHAVENGTEVRRRPVRSHPAAVALRRVRRVGALETGPNLVAVPVTSTTGELDLAAAPHAVA